MIRKWIRKRKGRKWEPSNHTFATNQELLDFLHENPAMFAHIDAGLVKFKIDEEQPDPRQPKYKEIPF